MQHGVGPGRLQLSEWRAGGGASNKSLSTLLLLSSSPNIICTMLVIYKTIGAPGSTWLAGLIPRLKTDPRSLPGSVLTPHPPPRAHCFCESIRSSGLVWVKHWDNTNLQLTKLRPLFRFLFIHLTLTFSYVCTLCAVFTLLISKHWTPSLQQLSF